MSNWIGLGIFLFVILAGLFGLYQLSKPYDVSAEEFEKRAKEGPGLASAAMIGLQKMLEPQTKRAIEAQEDFKAGRYNKEDDSGDPPEPGQDREHN